MREQADPAPVARISARICICLVLDFTCNSPAVQSKSERLFARKLQNHDKDNAVKR